MMSKSHATLAAIACSALFAAPTLAVTVFSDGFETAPDPTPDTWAQQSVSASPTDSDPANTTRTSFTAQPGNWFEYGGTAAPIYDIQVTNNASPGAASGNNYLRIHRSTNNDVAIAAAFAPWNDPYTSGTVTASFDAYFPSAYSGNSFYGGVFMAQYLDNDHGSGTIGSKPVLFVRGSGVIRQSFGLFGNNPDLASPSVTEDKWQHWTIAADLDTQTYVLTIDGVSSAPAAFNYPGSAVAGLVFNGQPGSEYYVDNVSVDYVPEPACIGLAAIAGLGLIRRRRV